MIEFVESPLFDNWFKSHIPNNKLIICSPYMKQNALDMVLDLYDVRSKYETLEIQVLIRGNEKEFTVNKSSDITVLNTFLALPGFDIQNFKRIENLHMKAYLVDDSYLLITSGNLTNSGMFVVSGKENFEGGIATDDEGVIGRFKAYFEHIWNQGEILENFYDDITERYAEYIQQEYSDHETVKRIKRKNYKFNSKSKIDVNVAQVGIEETDDLQEGNPTLALHDLPPVGNVTYINDTLDIVINNTGISFRELGRKLREKYNMYIDPDEKKARVADNKFGEEKAKFAEYFGLLIIQKSEHPYAVEISSFGKSYLSMDTDSRNKYLKDQMFSKYAIMDILNKCSADGLSLIDYLKKYYDATESTLARKRGAINKLFDFVKNELNPDQELLDLLEQVK